MLDLDQIIATAAKPERLLNFHLTEHEEGPITAIFEFDNADHTLPAPADGETEEAVIHEPPDMAFGTHTMMRHAPCVLDVRNRPFLICWPTPKCAGA